MAFRLPVALRLAGVRFMASGSGVGEFGSGAGKGGGSGGAVREAGGAFGKMEAAHEEMYFKKLEREQMAKLRKHLEEEVDYHKDQIEEHKTAIQLARIKDHFEEEVEHHEKAIREHEEAIERHKKKIQKLHYQEKDIKERD